MYGRTNREENNGGMVIVPKVIRDQGLFEGYHKKA